MNSNTIGFIGAGNMASSLIRGLLSKSVTPSSILASDIDEKKLQELAKSCGVSATTNQQIADSADIILLAVKPQVMKRVCSDLVMDKSATSPLIVSIAAGITTGHLQNWLGCQHAIVRCMPNTPALIGEGISGLFANANVSSHQKELAEKLMRAVGTCVWVDDESDIDTVTAVSGSGPAYFFLFIEAMRDAAREMGLSDETANALVYQTAAGAAKLAISSEEDVSELRRNVTSPGGTTERALNMFEEGKLKELVERALHAARDRSIELANEFGNK